MADSSSDDGPAAVGPSRLVRLTAALGFATVVALVGAASAAAAPVTLDFESGATLNQPVTNQYGPPGTPAGPTFKAGIDAGFKGLYCGPPRLDNTAVAHSGSNSLLLNGCAGGEFWPTAAFFSLGYSTDSVDFWIATPGETLGNTTVITTAFDAQRSVVLQEETILPPQKTTTYKQVVLPSSEDNIAYVAVEQGTKGTNTNTATGVGLTAGNSYLSLDDLTYDPPSSPPESSFLLGANPPVAGLVPGGQTELSVPINWTNNPDPSASPVALEASLPSGISGSFSPNPTSGGSSTLTLHAAKNAATGASSMTIDGYVDRGLASEKHSSLTIPLEVSPAFEVVDPGAVTVSPCTPRQVALKVQTATSFTEPITLSVVTPGSSGAAITGISGGGLVSDPTHAATTVTPQGGIATATVTLSALPGSGNEGARFFSVTASAPGYSDRSAYGTVAVSAGEISKVLATGTSYSPPSVSTPALGAPGSQLTLQGAGFCPDTAVAIGDPHNPATPEAIAADGRSLTFRVPRGAVSGPIDVLPHSGQPFAGPNLQVRSFRNTYGFSWENGDYHLRLNEAMVDELFGQQETNIDVFGWLIRKPEAYLFETMANNYIPGGICFGMGYSSYEFQQGLISPSYFPHSGGGDAWNLDGPTAPSNALLRYVTERFSLQFTDQLIPAELNTVLGIHGTDDAINAIQGELALGRPVLLGLIHWNGISLEGHTVLAYDAHPAPGGGVAVQVANSNVPYRTSEESDPGAHDAAEFTNSQLVIKEGNWSFPQLGWSGSEADLVVYHHDELPEINGHRPSLPNVFTAAVMVAFGSSGDAVTQLTDGHGSLFKGGQLAPPSSWPKGVAPVADFTAKRAPLQLVTLKPSAGRELTATVKRGAGGGDMNMYLPGLQASLHADAKAGQRDQVGLDPGSDSIDYRSGAAATGFGGTLLSAPGATAGAASSAAGSRALSDHLVRFQTSAGGGGDERLSFPSGRSFELEQSGRAATLKLTLSAFDARGRPTAVRLPAVHLAAGERVKVTPSSWRSLGSAKVRIRSLLKGHSSVRGLRGHLIGRRFATVRRAALLTLKGNQQAVTLKLRLHHLPKHGWLSIAGTLSRGGHVVQRGGALQLSAAALRSGKARLLLPKRVPRGRYSLRLRLLEVTASGAIQGSRSIAQTFALRGGKG